MLELYDSCAVMLHLVEITLPVVDVVESVKINCSKNTENCLQLQLIPQTNMVL